MSEAGRVQRLLAWAKRVVRRLTAWVKRETALDRLLAWMERSRGRAWTVMIALAVLLGVLGARAAAPSTPISPNGILELELAGTGVGALALVRAFEQYGVRTGVIASIGHDFLFIPAYAITLFALLRFLAGLPPAPPVKGITVTKAALAAVVVAALADVAENICMLTMLKEPVAETGAQLSMAALFGALAATFKWVALALACGHLAWLWLRWMLATGPWRFGDARLPFPERPLRRARRDVWEHALPLYILALLGLLLLAVWGMFRVMVCWGPHGLLATAACNLHVLSFLLAVFVVVLFGRLLFDLAAPLEVIVTRTPLPDGAAGAAAASPVVRVQTFALDEGPVAAPAPSAGSATAPGAIGTQQAARRPADAARGVQAAWRGYGDLKGRDFAHASAAGLLVLMLVLACIVLMFSPVLL